LEQSFKKGEDIEVAPAQLESSIVGEESDTEIETADILTDPLAPKMKSNLTTLLEGGGQFKPVRRPPCGISQLFGQLKPQRTLKIKGNSRSGLKLNECKLSRWLSALLPTGDSDIRFLFFQKELRNLEKRSL
jgi:hypothetical protein